jgi:hypothetical protein
LSTSSSTETTWTSSEAVAAMSILIPSLKRLPAGGASSDTWGLSSGTTVTVTGVARALLPALSVTMAPSASGPGPGGTRNAKV